MSESVSLSAQELIGLPTTTPSSALLSVRPPNQPSVIPQQKHACSFVQPVGLPNQMPIVSASQSVQQVPGEIL